MLENRIEQKEALETLGEFNQRLVKNMHIIIRELSGKRLDDTDKFLSSIVNAINWEIQVMNGTMELLNENKQRINKERFNSKIIELDGALQSKDDVKLMKAFSDILPYFIVLGNAIEEVLKE